MDCIEKTGGLMTGKRPELSAVDTSEESLELFRETETASVYVAISREDAGMETTQY